MGTRVGAFLSIAGVTLGWAALGLLVRKLDLLPAPVILMVWLVGFYWLAKVRNQTEALLLWLLALAVIGVPIIVFAIVRNW